MADNLYLSIWFPTFEGERMLERLGCVAQRFPFANEKPGITYLAVRPLSWNEATVFERRFDPPVPPVEAVLTVAEFIHDDFAYELEAWWELWTPNPSGRWEQSPQRVRIIAHGTEFDDATFERDGHIQVDFGLDAPFLYEELRLTAETEDRVRANIQKLVTFSADVEQHCAIRGRVLWSESDENLAQKLIHRLQRVQ